MNYCIYMGDKKQDALACPNQLQSFGVFIDEWPSLFFPNKSNVQQLIADNITFPLKTKDPLTYLSIQRPILREITDNQLHHISLMSPHRWDPYGIESFSPQRSSEIMCWISFDLSHQLPNMIQPCDLSKKKGITPKDLVLRWGIGTQTARLTLASTYQEHRRATDSLTRRSKFSRAHSRFPTLERPYSQFYTDVLFSKIISPRGITCGQVYFSRARYL